MFSFFNYFTTKKEPKINDEIIDEPLTDDNPTTSDITPDNDTKMDIESETKTKPKINIEQIPIKVSELLDDDSNSNNNNNNNDNNMDSKDNNDDNMDSDDDDSLEFLGGPFETLEDELAFLRKQNSHLMNKLKQHKNESKKLSNKLNKNVNINKLINKIEQKIPEYLKKLNINNDTIYIPTNNNDEVGIINIKNVDWWDFVDINTLNKANSNNILNNNNINNINNIVDCILNDEDPYINIDENEITDAVAYFVAQCVISIPECRNLTHKELLKMIDQTFGELKQKGTFGQIKDWYKFIKFYYGWGQTAYSVYSNAFVARAILTGVSTAAWIIGIAVL